MDLGVSIIFPRRRFLAPVGDLAVTAFASLNACVVPAKENRPIAVELARIAMHGFTATAAADALRDYWSAVTGSLAIDAYRAVNDAGPADDVLVDRAANTLFHMMNRRRVTLAEVLVPPAATLRGSI